MNKTLELLYGYGNAKKMLLLRVEKDLLRGENTKFQSVKKCLSPTSSEVWARRDSVRDKVGSQRLSRKQCQWQHWCRLQTPILIWGKGYPIWGMGFQIWGVPILNYKRLCVCVSVCVFRIGLDWISDINAVQWYLYKQVVLLQSQAQKN